MYSQGRQGTHGCNGILRLIDMNCITRKFMVSWTGEQSPGANFPFRGVEPSKTESMYHGDSVCCTHGEINLNGAAHGTKYD